MQILISCAKTMAAASDLRMPALTHPQFDAEASALAASLAALPAETLGRLLRVNPRLAAENRRRYLNFHDGPALAALAAYTGVVFKHIAPADFTPADHAYAAGHLNITSFLYGLLRPSDAIRLYRAEGDMRLEELDGRSLFEYWQPLLTDALLARIHADDGVLVNLASGEMKRLFDWRRICREARVLTPEFRVADGGRLRTVVVYAKMCRGEMTRWLLRGRIDDPGRLREFAWEGFRFDADRSRGDRLQFTL